MENKELKPCPFCEGKAVLDINKVRKGYEATIQCNGRCILYMTTITYETAKEAVESVINAWNRRAENGKS